MSHVADYPPFVCRILARGTASVLCDSDSSAGSVSCGVGISSFFVDPPSGTEQVSWTPAPPGTYMFEVIYCGSNPQGAPLSFSADVLVSPNPAQNLTTRALSDIGDFQSFSFSVP